MVFKDEIWLIGGTGSVTETVLKISTYKQGGTWQNGTRLPDGYSTTPDSAVNGMGAVVLDNKLYILGKFIENI